MIILNKTNFKLFLLIIITNLFVVLSPNIYLYYLDISEKIIYSMISLSFLLGLLITNTTWALIHEGIHSNLNINSKKNLLYSRILSLLLHSNFELLKFGHLMHHKYNRSASDLTEGYDNNLKFTKNKFSYYFYLFHKTISYYFYIIIGLYLGEVIGPLLLLLPKKIIIYLADYILGKDHSYLLMGKKIILNNNPKACKKLRNIRIDSFINIAIFFSIFYLYGEYIYLYLIFLFIRGLLISSADNLPHYGCNTDKIYGAYNLQTNKIWQSMILNFNYHRVHHKYPNIAWHLLPEKFNSDGDCFDKNYFQQYTRQWRGIVAINNLDKFNK